MSLSSSRVEEELITLERQYWQLPDWRSLGIRLVALEQQLAALWMVAPPAGCAATYTGTLHDCTGAGWVGQTVTLKNHATGATLGTATTIAAGAFSGSITLPGSSSLSVDVTTSGIAGYSNFSTTLTFVCGANAIGTISPTATPNLAPTIDAIGSITTCGDGASRNVSLTGITDGDGGTQAPITVTATSSNTGIIPNPTITYTSPATTGTLAYVATNAGTSGVAVTLTVKVVDSGGTACSGVDTKTRTFTVTALPIDQPVKLDPIGNISTGHPIVGVQTINLSGINAGTSISGTPTITITATSDNHAVFPDPTVNYTSPNSTGTLTFSWAGSTGTANFTVTMTVTGSTGVICTSLTSKVRTFSWTVS